jgi:hypothetical protein
MTLKIDPVPFFQKKWKWESLWIYQYCLTTSDKTKDGLEELRAQLYKYTKNIETTKVHELIFAQNKWYYSWFLISNFIEFYLESIWERINYYKLYILINFIFLESTSKIKNLNSTPETVITGKNFIKSISLIF